ncbi:MAG: TetR/AcrR family transcriptional regulator, partial [Bryobacteraceae bacterium]
MSTAESRRERKKAGVRDRIISAAIGIFSERTIEQATVDEIAAAADVGKGTIYNYFQSKEDIVVAFLVGIERQVQGRVGRFASAKGSLQQILVSFLQFQLKLKRPHYQFVRVFLAQMFARGGSSSPWIAQLQEAIDPPLEHFFSTLQDRGLIREDIDRRDLIQFFKMLHVGLMTIWVM